MKKNHSSEKVRFLLDLLLHNIICVRNLDNGLRWDKEVEICLNHAERYAEGVHLLIVL